MFVKTQDGEVKFFFKHEAPVWKRNGSRKARGLAASGVTVCVLSYQERTFVGIARCSASDRYEKDRGRQIALKRAIEQLPNEVRRTVWESYSARTTGDRNVAIEEVDRLIELGQEALDEFKRIRRELAVETQATGANGSAIYDPQLTVPVQAIPELEHEVKPGAVGVLGEDQGHQGFPI